MHLSVVFLSIFGPRLYGSVYLDTLTISLLLMILYSNKTINEHLRKYHEIKSVITILLVIICVSFISYSVNNFVDLFWFGRHVRAIINIIAVYGYTILLLKKYGTKKINDIIVICIFIHSLIMIVQYLNPSFRSIIYELSGYAKEKNTRVTGLTVSYNTLNVVNSAAIYLILLTTHRTKNFYTTILRYVTIVPIVFAMFLAGRTSIYVMFILSILCVTFTLNKASTVKAMILISAFTIIFIVALNDISNDEQKQRFKHFTFYNIYEPIEAIISGGSVLDSYGGRNLDGISRNMYHLPDTINELVIGNSYSGRDDYYTFSDVGYVRLLYGNGIFSVICVIFLYLVLIKNTYSKSYKSNSNFIVLVFFIISCLILNLKENVLLTRHALTILSMLYAICVYDKITIRNVSQNTARRVIQHTNT